MTGQDLIAEMLELSREMQEAIADLKSEGIAAAEHDRAYRCFKANKIAQLRLDGAPATITEALANGYEPVANARCERDKYDALHRASLERLQLIKRKYDLLKSMWERER